MPSASTRRVRAAVSGSPSRLPTNAGADIRLFAIELNARVTGFAPSNGTELADPVTATRRGRPDAVGCVASLEWLEMAIAAISSLHSSLHSTLCNACSSIRVRKPDLLMGLRFRSTQTTCQASRVAAMMPMRSAKGAPI